MNSISCGDFDIEVSVRRAGLRAHRSNYTSQQKSRKDSLVGSGLKDSYLVDSASSHMLVSKIKPCMSKYKQVYCETANGSLNQLSFI
jgi:hypothetical protein